MSNYEVRHSPDAEFRFFVYCPNDGDFTYYRSAEERDQGAERVIQMFLDDGWDEQVEQVVAGEMTHICGQTGREDRPADTELEENLCDGEGKFWSDWSYTCNYDLLPLPAAENPAPDRALPSVAVEGDELVIRVSVDTLCHAVTMGDNWPTNESGESIATIVDRPLFMKEFVVELERDNEQGATPLHLLFDDMALELIERGTESIELHEEGDEK